MNGNKKIIALCLSFVLWIIFAFLLYVIYRYSQVGFYVDTEDVIFGVVVNLYLLLLLYSAILIPRKVIKVDRQPVVDPEQGRNLFLGSVAIVLSYIASSFIGYKYGAVIVSLFHVFDKVAPLPSCFDPMMCQFTLPFQGVSSGLQTLIVLWMLLLLTLFVEGHRRLRKV